MRRSVLSADGRSALDRVIASHRPLLAFDFDGTLAPIVARPDDARLPLPVVRRLARLSAYFETAIVTGRSVADVTSRLAFEPRHVIGNHGAEDPGSDIDPNVWTECLDPVRSVLRAARSQLEVCGVAVEDKGLSLALHYRLAPDGAVARAAIAAALRGFDRDLTIGHGKCVVNLAPLGAPDKGDALLAISRRIGADAGLYVGDDENDEPAFAKLDAEWVTVRVGQVHAETHATFCLDSPSQMPLLLQHLIDTARIP